MYEEFLELFPEFFDLIISINRIFFVKNFRGSFWTMHYFMYSCITSQFLDESSNLKAGCKKDVFHDAFDAIYVSQPRFFMCCFSPSSGNGRHCPFSTSGTSGTLCACPARTEVRGATVKGSFSR